jgi:hypothetical protein
MGHLMAEEATGALRVEHRREMGAPTLRDKLEAYFALTKPRIIGLLLITTVPSMVVAERGIPDLSLILYTLVGGGSRPVAPTPSTVTSIATSTRSCRARDAVPCLSAGSRHAARSYSGWGSGSCRSRCCGVP